MKTLEDYISDISEAVDEPVEVVVEKKKIGRPKGAKNMSYHFCSTFNSLSEAKEIVTMEKIWRYRKDQTSKTVKSGWHKKFFYVCYIESDCESRLQLVLHSDSEKVSIYGSRLLS